MQHFVFHTLEEFSFLHDDIHQHTHLTHQVHFGLGLQFNQRTFLFFVVQAFFEVFDQRFNEIIIISLKLFSNFIWPNIFLNISITIREP